MGDLPFCSVCFGLPFVKQRRPLMKKPEELVVITKTYDLILWSCNHTSRFPRQHRFCLNANHISPFLLNSQLSANDLNASLGLS